jgi:diguanylate cyclase (GGDEF)-like protein
LQDDVFYGAMWDSLRRTGRWQGELWNRRKSGEVYPQWLTITAVRNEEKEVTRYVGTMLDISERKTREDEVTQLAFYDPLTNLPNRRLMKDRLQQALASSARTQCEGVLMFIDLDHFKNVNDTLGHDKGDLLLQQVARRLVACVREGDTVARLGGDEFVVMLPAIVSDAPIDAAGQAKAIGEKILESLHRPYQIAGSELRCSVSIGITLFGHHNSTVDELLKRADQAMYQAKSAGRNMLRFFDSSVQESLRLRSSIEAELRQAIRRRELILHYQPLVDAERRLVGAEALLRWQHPQRGLVLPDGFIAIAEEVGLIDALGRWALDTACAQLKVWSRDPALARLHLAVNVCAHQIRDPDFVQQVMSVVERHGADPTRLKLELTESVLLHDVDDTIAKMNELKARGVGFALDDFGAGYSSLSYLRRLPLEQLKADRSFVHEMLTHASDAVIVRTIIDLGRSLNLTVIAEGVETEAQYQQLARYGCQGFQGHLFGLPMPIDELDRLARQQVAPTVDAAACAEGTAGAGD